MSLTRRRFVARTAALGTGAALGAYPALALLRTARAAGLPGTAVVDAADHPAVLYDLTRCAGCHFCEVACQANKGLSPEKALLTFKRVESPEGFPDDAWLVRRQQCMHCLDPACVSACPVGAMEKTAAGPVVYHDDKCLGCRYCMNVCPFGVPRFDWESGLLDGALIRKCDFCADRQTEGRIPACVEACPTGAVTFGERGELLDEARKRLREHPGQYIEQIYGETEAGGTSFLLLSGVAFAELGLPDPGHHSLPDLSEKVMSGVLPFAGAWLTVLVGVTGLLRWRQQRTGSEIGGADAGGKEGEKQ